jgi:hypothetical protein
MKKTEEYRRHAEECRVLARSASTTEEREQILTMAAMWERLANERIALQQQKVRTGENPIV